MMVFFWEFGMRIGGERDRLEMKDVIVGKVENWKYFLVGFEGYIWINRMFVFFVSCYVFVICLIFYGWFYFFI